MVNAQNEGLGGSTGPQTGFVKKGEHWGVAPIFLGTASRTGRSECFFATRAAAGDHSSDSIFRRNGPPMLRDASGHGFRMTFTFATNPQIACELLSVGLDVSEPWSICHDAGTPRNAIRSGSSQQRAVDGKRWLFAPRARHCCRSR
jgi:hypothetical protein